MDRSFIARRSGLTWTRSGDSVVILDLDSSQYFSLNSTAGSLWPQLVAGTHESDLVHALITRYGIDDRTAVADVRDLITNLEQRSLISPLGVSTSA